MPPIVTAPESPPTSVFPPVSPSQQPVPSLPPAPPPSTPPSQPAKKGLKGALLGLLMLGVATSSAAGGYYIANQRHTSQTINQTNKVASGLVTVPKDATITAECVAGRGKQYILPKDIPDGPIYDVHNGKVVAIEYLIGTDELSKTPGKYSALSLPTGSYNHLTLMPMDPHAGLAEPHFHVINYLISATEAKKITCNSPSNTETPVH